MKLPSIATVILVFHLADGTQLMALAPHRSSRTCSSVKLVRLTGPGVRLGSMRLLIRFLIRSGRDDRPLAEARVQY